ncbi:MAG: hypothetical protein AB1567_06980 [bacterium]
MKQQAQHSLFKKMIDVIQSINYGEVNLKIKVQNGLPMLIEETTNTEGMVVTKRHQLGQKRMND